VFKEVATSPLASDPRCQHDLGQGRCAVCQPNSAAVSASCCELGCKLATFLDRMGPAGHSPPTFPIHAFHLPILPRCSDGNAPKKATLPMPSHTNLMCNATAVRVAICRQD